MRTNSRKLGLMLSALLLVALLFSTFGAVLVTAQTTWYVDDGTCPAVGDGSATNPFCKIQDAINAASAGDTINVAAGTYNEDVTVNKSLTLNGAQAGVDARGRSASESEIVGVVKVTSAATNVVFDGFKFTSPTRGFTPRGFNLRVESENSTIKNCIFVAEENAGHTYSGYLDFGGIKNTTVERNSFSGDLDPTQEPNVILLYITGAGTVTVADNEMHNVGGGGGVGIMCSNDSAVINIEDNEFENTGDGIWIWPYADKAFSVSITGNDIHDCSKDGVKLLGGCVGDVHINHNNIYNNNLQGCVNGCVASVDATCNWWGAVDGPSGSGPGSGDAVSDNVAFQPWLTQAAPSDCDYQGPLTHNVAPSTVAVNTPVILTATVDDSTTGNTVIASAQYNLDDGGWTAMSADEGFFDEVTEDVEASISAFPETGIHEVCVRGTDAAGNTGPKECILLAVYDPEGGFVTGGGWIDSPPGAYMPGPSGIVVVTEQDVDVNWFTNDTRYNGYVAFVEGPGTPPLGVGSLEMGTTASQDKAQLFNYDHIGTLLAHIDALSYATYRHSNSTNPPAQYPAINIEVDYVGDGSSYTTLVWEPIYAYGQSNLAVDMWQPWDTMAPSQTSFGGGWWSTRTIPGVLCNPNNPTGCVGEPFYVSWDYILTNLPNAKIMGGFGVNVGSGWDGNFTGAVDALTLSVSGGTVTYDFEPVAPFDPTGKATFGFVSKYKKGAQIPEGQTEFVFKAADLNFHSDSYEWLVVAGARAKFKGIGTINGEGPYKFMLTAIDADINENDSFDVDRFRIKIWDEVDDTEHVIYDNGLGGDEDDDNATTEIGGGSIVIHTKKK